MLHITKMKARRFGDTLPIRITTEVDRRLSQIRRATGLTKSDIARMAIAHGLPELEAGRIRVDLVPQEAGK